MERPVFQPVGTPAIELDTPALVVDLDIAKAGFYEISIYDLQGRLVRIIHHGSLNSGRYTFTLRTNIPSGIYFIQAETDEFSSVKKMVRLK